MKFSSLRLSAATFALLASCPWLEAQVITSAPIERGLSISGPISNGYVPFSHRYFYGTGPYVYVNGDARRIVYLDYLDRLDRAEKFGYPIPADPFAVPEAVVMPAEPRVWISGGYGHWRRR